MSVVVYKVHRKSDGYIRGSLAPLNRSQEPRFGVLDGVITGLVLLCACALGCLLAL